MIRFPLLERLIMPIFVALQSVPKIAIAPLILVWIGAGIGSKIAVVASIAFFLPSLALLVRRLHDVGRSGWWFLIVFTVIGVVVLLYWLVKASDAGTNAYGEGPARA